MALEYGELEKIIDEVVDKVTQEIILANRMERLNEVLEKYGISYKEERYVDRNAKILIIGDSQISESNIRGIAKSFNIDEDLLECELEYKKIKNYNFNKLEYNTNYHCILVGPMPHSVNGKSDYSSIIAKMENEKDKYPEVIRVTNSNELKITKSSLKQAFKNLVQNLNYQFL